MAPHSPQRRERRSRRSRSRSHSRSPARAFETSVLDRRRRHHRSRSPRAFESSASDSHHRKTHRFHSNSRSRSRSASPVAYQHRHRHRHRRNDDHHHHHRRERDRRGSSPAKPTVKVAHKLPFDASPLDKRGDFAAYQSLFGLYLDIQKGLVMEELGREEIKGRWKGWVGRWNRGELAEGWYEPETLRKAQVSAATALASRPDAKARLREDPRSADLSEDDVGPAPPRGRSKMAAASKAASDRHGPAIPSLQDLELRRETAYDESQAQRLDLHHQRRLDRRSQKAQLEDLVPRAEAGTKDRLIEKKREKADNHRAFASAKIDAVGGMAEVPDSDLLGGGDDGEGGEGIEGFKKQQREMERKKNEREIRREEIMRARQMEREGRLREYRAREEKTMSGLIKIAKARFG